MQCFVFSSVQLLSYVQLFATPWTAARQASLSITDSRSLCLVLIHTFSYTSDHIQLLKSPQQSSTLFYLSSQVCWKHTCL